MTTSGSSLGSTQTVPMSDLLHSSLEQCRGQMKVVVGIAVFRAMPEPGLLLVKRASTEDVLPDFWELPGGKVEASDQSVLAAMERELLEETGLTIHRVLDMLEPFAYVLPKEVTDQDGNETWIHTPSIQFNAAVMTDPESTVQLNPTEHSEYRWVNALEEIDHMTEGMQRVVGGALAWWEARKTQAMTEEQAGLELEISTPETS